MEKQIIIESRLLNDWDFCSMCLLKLYEQQTDDEQGTGDTHHENGKGFNKADAVMLSVFAQGVSENVEILSGTRKIIAERLTKYAKQLTTLLTDEQIEL